MKRREELKQQAVDLRKKRTDSPNKSKPKSPSKVVDENDLKISGMEIHPDLTQGDKDLEPFLKPLLKKAGSNLKTLEFAIKRRPDHEGTLDVVGIRIWNAIHSENWRVRDAATEALHQFLTK